MDHLVDQILGLGSGKVIGPTETIASGNPVPRHSLPQHDGIEEIARPLDAHDPSPSLVEVLQKEPDLEALGL